MNETVNGDQSHRSGKASATTRPDALRAECAPIPQRLGPRRSRRISHLLYAKLLSVGLTPGKAAEIAQTVAGVRPNDLLTAREAHNELRRMGIRKSRRFLYRLGRKFAASEQPGEIWLDVRGNWGGRGQVRNAAAVLVVEGGSTPRFSFMPASPPVTNCENP
jgi:hypothetical protein